MNGRSKPILLSDDTSIMFYNSDLEDFKNDKRKSSNPKINGSKPTVSLKFDKTHFMQFTNKINPQIDPDITILI